METAVGPIPKAKSRLSSSALEHCYTTSQSEFSQTQHTPLSYQAANSSKTIMNFKTCLAVALVAVVATVATAEDPLYCQAIGCPTLYSEANLAVSKECRDQGKLGDDFHRCCEEQCGSTTPASA
ncbi:hypothetical protein JG687_00010104 [Phytophthora cactorum]|uniref:Phytotoxin PcF domain-containing protein n=3 Tax=Phytophthora cactorum TaxID=29920 RepID=A0A8T1U7Q0_9STRA|nr:Phytotoxin, PcF [Phytophthora cactorum]KAG6957246.1 hypothetical protein JG687_00010104 [Phytophthora cactorum]